MEFHGWGGGQPIMQSLQLELRLNWDVTIYFSINKQMKLNYSLFFLVCNSQNTCDKQPYQTKPSIFGTFWRISQPHNLGLTYRLLRWNGVANPVLLNIINPLFENIIFFGLKGGAFFLGSQDHHHFPYFLHSSRKIKSNKKS